MAPALRAGGGELRGGWGRALHLPALPRVAVEGAAHDERARAHQRRVPPPHQDAGAVAHRGRRPFAPLRPPAQRAHHAPTTRRLARDPELGPNRQQGSVASSEENNDSSTVPDDALRSFPPLDRHRRVPFRRHRFSERPTWDVRSPGAKKAVRKRYLLAAKRAYIGLPSDTP